MNLSEATRQYQAALEHARHSESAAEGALTLEAEVADAWLVAHEAYEVLREIWIKDVLARQAAWRSYAE